MTSRVHPPTRTMRDQPDLAQLKRQAKELLKAFAAGDAEAVAEVNAHMLCLLLDLGLDPDESGKVAGLEEVVPTSGGPLRECAKSGDIVMAEALLAHGANPNTHLGWACRWGRIELVKLLLERGADPIEANSEPWARPRAWAETMNRRDVAAELRRHTPVR